MNVSPHHPVRKPAQILQDWRSLERRIGSAREEAEIRGLAERVEALREEYRAATRDVLASYPRSDEHSPED